MCDVRRFEGHVRRPEVQLSDVTLHSSVALLCNSRDTPVTSLGRPLSSSSLENVWKLSMATNASWSRSFTAWACLALSDLTDLSVISPPIDALPHLMFFKNRLITLSTSPKNLLASCFVWSNNWRTLLMAVTICWSSLTIFGLKGTATSDISPLSWFLWFAAKQIERYSRCTDDNITPPTCLCAYHKDLPAAESVLVPAYVPKLSIGELHPPISCVVCYNAHITSACSRNSTL